MLVYAHMRITKSEILWLVIIYKGNSVYASFFAYFKFLPEETFQVLLNCGTAFLCGNEFFPGILNVNTDHTLIVMACVE